ncbi:hypothetical protein [Bosea sp. (in: a-proteobacteria)]|uniref:hypothetical protein n=1 Tax=Bosea sp. (in: a-proteobacteria) TaxID=1871050 RepID=UPI0025B846D1|nr:hypothetical protein [Bosea sp. (in: a-proteobacteria)]
MPDKPVPNRIIKYEISTYREDRWVIESVREHEDEAVTLAKLFLATEKYDAVRVVRERRSPGDVVFETAIFEQARQQSKDKKPLSISSSDDDDCWCDTLDDLYGGRSRRAIGQLLRSFLDQLGITVVELLCQYRFVKKLDAAGNLRMSAVHRIARARSESTGAPAAECAKSLDRMIDTALVRARDALGTRGLPKMGDEGLDKLIARCNAAADSRGEQLFLMRYAIGRALEPRIGLADKMATAIGWLEGLTDPLGHSLVDELIADCLGSASMIQELLGRQPDMHGAMRSLIAIASDRYDGVPPNGPSWFPAFHKWLGERTCAETRAVLLARVRRELAGDRPLTRGSQPDEAKALNGLADMLRNDAEGTFFGGAGLVHSLARRWSRLDVAGGFGDLRLPVGAPRERLKALLNIERSAFGDSRKRAVATLILDTLREIPLAGRADLVPFSIEIGASGLLGPAKQAINRELAGTTAAAA